MLIVPEQRQAGESDSFPDDVERLIGQRDHVRDAGVGDEHLAVGPANPNRARFAVRQPDAFDFIGPGQFQQRFGGAAVLRAR